MKSGAAHSKSLWACWNAIILFTLLLGFTSIELSNEEPSPSGFISSGELRDITGIEGIPAVPARPWWHYVLVVAVVLLTTLFLAGWKYGRRYFGKSEASPGSWALAELGRIDSLDLPESDQVERYLTLYSEVIRQYLEQRFQLRASQQTTLEFFQAMGSSSLLNSSQQHVLKEFLERCDLAKFAQVRFAKEECQALGQSARLFVEETSSEAVSGPKDSLHR